MCIRDRLKGLRGSAQLQQFGRDFMDALFMVLGQTADAVGRLRMGGNKKGGLHGHDFVKGLQIGSHIIYKRYLVFVQGSAAAQAVSQE